MLKICFDIGKFPNLTKSLPFISSYQKCQTFQVCLGSPNHLRPSTDMAVVSDMWIVDNDNNCLVYVLVLHCLMSEQRSEHRGTKIWLLPSFEDAKSSENCNCMSLYTFRKNFSIFVLQSSHVPTKCNYVAEGKTWHV